MFEIFKKRKESIADKFNNTSENKYEMYGKKFEMLGYFRPIYKSENTTICYVSDMAYVFICNFSGVCIFIKSEAVLKAIEDPVLYINAYLGFSLEQQKKVAFLLHTCPHTEILLKKIKDNVIENPEIAEFNAEIEQKVFDLYGFPESSYPEKDYKQLW